MKKHLALIFVLFSALCALPAQQASSGVAGSAFVQGAKAFGSGEWMSAIFLLRKAVSYPENNTAETWYMLITAQMYAGEYKSAFQDCESYLQNFSGSPYDAYVLYHKGRALFFIGEYEKAILTLSDFCHQYPDHEMYASALYWVAESFYASYNFDDAKILYSAIVNEYPDDAKAVAAQYRLESIAQANREEKLLYLLKETGEEYLAAKEEYERQLSYAGAESTAEVRRRILDLQKRAAEQEQQIQTLKQENADLLARLTEEENKNADIKKENDSMLADLKRKASFTQELLDSKRSAGGSE